MNYIDLKSVESKAWRATFDDGLWDLALGLFMLALTAEKVLVHFAISEAVRLSIFVGLELAAIFVVSIGKRLFTLPRIGQVKFGAKRRAKLGKVEIITVAAVILGAGLWRGMESSPGQAMDSQRIMPALWALTALVTFGLAAYLFEYRRLYFIGFLYAATVPTLHFLKTFYSPVTAALVAFGVPALIILIMGEMAFVNFLRSTPVPQEEQ